jgi:hypothetical protein
VLAADTVYGTNLGVTLANITGSGASNIQAFIGGNCCTAVDPSSVFGQSVGYNVFGDNSVSLAYDIGTIAAGQSVTIGYSYTFAQAVPEPETYAMLLAGLGLMGFVARRRQRNLAA